MSVESDNEITMHLALREMRLISSNMVSESIDINIA